MKKTSSLPSHPKFLLDENVRRELFRFLRKEGYNVKLVPKSTTDSQIALLSKSQKRILVTNDSDFADPELYSKDELFALIWLRIPQSKHTVLLNLFSNLLSGYEGNYEGKLFIINENVWEVYNLMVTM